MQAWLQAVSSFNEANCDEIHSTQHGPGAVVAAAMASVTAQVARQIACVLPNQLSMEHTTVHQYFRNYKLGRFLCDPAGTCAGNAWKKKHKAPRRAQGHVKAIAASLKPRATYISKVLYGRSDYVTESARADTTVASPAMKAQEQQQELQPQGTLRPEIRQTPGRTTKRARA